METNQFEMELRSDPTKWAFWRLKDARGNPWKARWYQKKLLNDMRDGVKRLAIRMGRRVGKSETLVIFALWYAFHHENARILIAAPYENQVRLLFMRLGELIDHCDELAGAIVTRTKNPFVLTFGNGSSILGFTIGATSGQSGASIRGQRADFIFIDEADYCDRGGIDAVTAIALEDPKRIGIWCSSTPTGKRDFFYEICTNSHTGYKSYHFPSMVNPDWDDKMEGEMRATMTSQGFIHEVLADFGEETVGVFNKDFVDRSIRQFLYSYRELNSWEKEYYERANINLKEVVFFGPFDEKNKAPRAFRIIGVDWDKYGEATQIVITEFDELLVKFRVCGRYEIPRGEFTLDNAVKKIIELNHIYDPQFIYVDRGFGEYQLELLHLHGKNHPETGLYHKVKGIQFSQNIEVRDPATREVDHKDAKNFMVNQTSILFDRDQILLSYFDELLWKQAMDYQVIRISATGRPIYTSENEHALDAFMLTILGFTIQFPNITGILKKHDVARKTAIKQPNIDQLKQKALPSVDDLYRNQKKSVVREAKDNPNWHLENVPLGYYSGNKNNQSFTRGRMNAGFMRSKI